ncbi:AAA family ATPase [Halogeometricum sp. CBA1124]|uniref:AAA family ATPase n=1 Tax=Halogeometricum sp. CBA1124 TaxID=2668071 RepID=UPI0018D24E5B
MLNREFGSDLSSNSNVLISGPRGTGKTHIVQKVLEATPSTESATCYVSCRSSNTQYKALAQILSVLTNEDVSTGHHISSLQRRIRERVEALPLLVVLDDVEFLMRNDGSDLLYYLSRIPGNLRLLLTSTTPSVMKQADDRVVSSLQPHRLELESYSENQAFSILAERAEQALDSHSLQRDALQKIGETTQNISIGLYWLQVAGERRDTITSAVIEDVKHAAFRRYLDHLLSYFSTHHQLVVQAVMELLSESSGPVTTGEVYSRYEDLSEVYSESSVGHRSISDVLSELELLRILDCTYHYGGRHGKTREIELADPFNDSGYETQVA